MVLVLPAGLDVAEATDLALAYASAGAKLLVATRLDLAHRLGGILAAGIWLLLIAERPEEAAAGQVLSSDIVA